MTRFSRSAVASAFLVLALPTVLAAQGEARPTAPVVPANMMPPAGKCRIWMENVAPAQQPAPTDCQTAIRQRPTNGTVIFGPTPSQQDARKFEPPGTVRDSAGSRPRQPTVRRPTPEPVADSTPLPTRPSPTKAPERP